MRLLLLCCCVVALSACRRDAIPAPAGAAGAGDTTAAGAAAAPTAASAADDNLNAVLWIQRSAEYRAISLQTFRAAADHLDQALRQRHWDALAGEERGNPAAGLPPAVIVDVDETVLDNSPYQARLIRDGGEFDELGWDRWVAEKKARPLPGAVDFARAAAAKGVTVLYLSNRAIHLREATLANLREAGLPVADDSVFLGLGTVVEGCEQQGTEKDCRRRLAGQRYRVLMQFGDQLGDFVRISASTPEGRAQLLEEYRDWFGERWWMLPNPSYGSWESAAFGNDHARPPEARRMAKRASLDVAP